MMEFVSRLLPILRRAWVPAAVLVAIVGAYAAVAATRPSDPPVVVVTARWLPGSAYVPTADAWFSDGTRESITHRLGERWVPDRPLRMLTVAAEVGCEIWINGRIASSDQAARNRYAVCAWTVD